MDFAMNSRIAAELLYESEATLRMVDDALDELRLSEAGPFSGTPRLTVIRSGDDVDADARGVLSVRVFWQLQEVLDAVRESREALQAMSRQNVSESRGAELDRALALVDRLDTLEAGETERPALHAELRRELIAVLNRGDGGDRSRDRLTDVSNRLAESETRLARLGHLFESGDS
jgi:hypothetical protein